MSRVIGKVRRGCPKPAWSSPLSSSRAAPRPRSPATTACRKRGSHDSSPATAPKATPRSNHAHDDPTPDPTRPRPRRSSWSSSSAARLTAAGPRRRRRHHRLAPRNTTTTSRCRERRSTASSAAPSSSPPNRRRSRSRPTSASKPSNPTKPGKPTSPTGASPTAPTSRSSPGSTTTPATPCQSPPTDPSPDPIVVATFRAAIAAHGIPFSTLTDNGLVFTTRFAHGGRTSRNGLENELVKLRVRQKNSRPNHPTTCGKVERFQHTMKTLAPRPTTGRHDRRTPSTSSTPSSSIYNHHRPHRSLPHHATPAAVYTHPPQSRPRQPTTPTPSSASATTASATATSASASTATSTTSASDDPSTEPPSSSSSTSYDIRIIHATTGEIIRTLTINPERRYHGTGKPIGGPSRPYGPRKTRQPEP